MSENNIRVSYYLCVDDDKIIDLCEIKDMPPLTKYRDLCVFTGMFEDEHDLKLGLRRLGLLDRLDSNISIVKVKKTKGKTSIEKVYQNIIYRESLEIFSPRCIKDFFDENKFNIDLMEYIFKKYQRKYWESIKRASGASNRRDFKESLDRLKGISSKIKSDYKKLKTVDKLLYQLDEIKNSMDNGRVVHAAVPYDYDETLKRFVGGEIYYYTRDGRNPNVHGIISLVNMIEELKDIYDDIVLPLKTNSHNKIIASIQNVLDKNDYTHNSESDAPLESEDGEYDPDHYMYLNIEDVERVYKDKLHQCYIDAQEDQKANLESKKRRI